MLNGEIVLNCNKDLINNIGKKVNIFVIKMKITNF